MEFFDTHSHMYSDAFDDDREACMMRAAEVGVNLVALPNIDSASIAGLKDLRRKHPEQTIGMMGLHPTSVKANFKKELDIILQELDRGGYKAVGEIGIDLYWDKTFLAEQCEAFATQIEWAKQRLLPIAIHARDSLSEVFRMMDDACDERLGGVFHCFSGNEKEAAKALSYPGFYLGMGGVLTFKNGGLDKFISQIPLDRLVLETDAPYLAPTPFRGKRNETAYTKLVAEKLATLLERPLEEIAKVTTANARKLFKIDGKDA